MKRLVFVFTILSSFTLFSSFENRVEKDTLSEESRTKVISLDSLQLNKLIQIFDKEKDTLSTEILKSDAEISSYNNQYKWWTVWVSPLIIGLVPFFGLLLTFWLWKKEQKGKRIEIKEKEDRDEINRFKNLNLNQLAKGDLLIQSILEYLRNEAGGVAKGTYLAMQFLQYQNTSGYNEHVESEKKAHSKIMWDFFCLEADYFKSHHSHLLNVFLLGMPDVWDDKMKTEISFSQLFQSQELAIKKVLQSEISSFYASWIAFKKTGIDPSHKHEREHPHLTYLAQIIINNLKNVTVIIPETSEYKNAVEDVCLRAYRNRDLYEYLVKSTY